MALDPTVLKARAGAAYRAFTPAQLVLAGLLLVVAVVGVLFFSSWVSAPSYGVLFSGLAAKDAADVTTKLQADGVPYKLDAGGTSIEVPTDKVDAERIALSAAGLPKGGQAGWDVFDKSNSLTSSTFTQQVDYQRALEGEIGRTLGEMDGVSNATVHLVLPQQQVFSDQQSPAHASVLLDTNGQFSAAQAKAVVQLVASAVPNLDPSNVTVSDTSGHVLSSSGADGTGSDDHQRAVEDALTAKAQALLDSILGPGHAVAQVAATLDASKRHSVTQTFDKRSVVPTSESKSSEQYGNGSTGTAQGPVSTTNTATTTTPATAAAGSATSGNYLKTTDVVNNGVNSTTTTSDTAPGEITRLNVAVAVDKNVPGAPSPAALSQLVGNAVGVDGKRGDSVVVTSTTFNSAPARAPKGGGLAALGKNAGTTAGTAVAALMLLVITAMLARAVKKPKVKEIPLPADALPPALPAGDERLALPAGSASRAGAISGGTALVPAQRVAPDADDLVAVVDAKTDDVAKLLRGWLIDTPGSAQ